MDNFQRLQIIACACTIANFACVFFGIDASKVEKFVNPDRTVQSELIASR
jgi:hypothetical protein